MRSIVPILTAMLIASPLAAQGRGQDGVPPGHRPPAGMCRIWIDGVPPGQQAAPTDCPTAVRNRPANGRVIFGDENGKLGKGFKPSRLRGEDARKDDDDDKDNEREAKAADRDDADRIEKSAPAKKSKKAKKDDASKPKSSNKKGKPNDI